MPSLNLQKQTQRIHPMQTKAQFRKIAKLSVILKEKMISPQMVGTNKKLIILLRFLRNYFGF